MRTKSGLRSLSLVALMIGAVAARLRARDGVALCLLPAFVGLICAVLVART